jgi:type IV secretion system protein VirD4
MMYMIDLDIKKKRYTHGSAAMARGREARPYIHHRARFQLPTIPWMQSRALQIFPIGQRPPESLLVLGKYQGHTISLDERQQEEHLMLLSQTGGGKSSLIIIPSLLREQGSRSLFIADVKDELYHKTAGAIAKHHTTWRFAPFDLAHSQCYNPLQHIHSVSDAQEFAASWVKNTGEDQRTPFWGNAARQMITAVVLHLRHSEPYASFSRLADLLADSSYDDLKSLLEQTRSPLARRAGRQFIANMETNERQIASVMTDIATRFQVLADPEIRDATARNEIDFSRMCREQIAFYLSVPYDEIERLSPLLSTMIMQMFRAWRQAARKTGGVLSHGIACYLDEFGNMGHINGFPSFVSTARSMRVSLLMALQSFSQLEDLYGPKGARSIRSNTVSELLLPGAGLEECEYFSKRAGETTVQTYTHTGSRGSRYESYNESATRRMLYTADELRRMPERSIMMIRGRSAPIMARGKPYFENRQLRSLSQLPVPSVIQVQMEEDSTPVTPDPPRGLPGPGPSIVVDADLDDPEESEDNDPFSFPE